MICLGIGCLMLFIKLSNAYAKRTHTQNAHAHARRYNIHHRKTPKKSEATAKKCTPPIDFEGVFFFAASA